MRSTELLSIRPKIDVDSPTKQSPAEVFQNNTLRPILKYQHVITLRLLMNNKGFRSQILGCIIGMMTIEEYDQYQSNAREYTKRIINMQIQRYADAIAKSLENN